MSTGCPERTAARAAAQAPVPAVRLRDLEPGDDASLLEIFAGLGPRSRLLRFLAPKTRLSATDLRQLTDVDGRGHVAVLAETTAGGHPVGVARFVRDADDPQVADVAVAVVDNWQRRGIGTLLASALVRRARDAGIRRVTAAMLVENDGAARLLHRMDGEVECLEIDSGVAELSLSLAPPRPLRLLEGGQR